MKDPDYWKNKLKYQIDKVRYILTKLQEQGINVNYDIMLDNMKPKPPEPQPWIESKE